MKRFLILIAALAFSSTFAGAQDLITKKDGQDIKARVLEVGPDNIKYKLYDEPDGDTYSIETSEILLIRYESGRNEVFNEKSSVESYYTTDREPAEGIKVGMKYQELKDIYNYRLYERAVGDRFNPVIAGLESFFIPGLGQMMCGETGRGLILLGASVGAAILSGVLSNYGPRYEMHFGNITSESSFVGLPLRTGVLALQIYSIIDAVRVAKVKNMYEQDLRSGYSLEADIFPSVNYTMVNGSVTPTAGLTLSLKF